jgi:integrase
MTVEEQYKIWIERLATRKRNPVKGATLATYQSCWRKWVAPILGRKDLSEIENGAMKRLVAKLAGTGLSPASIAVVTNIVKGIVSSAIDENGNERYPRRWNTDFIDAPLVIPKDQNAPSITSLEASTAIATASGQYAPLFALLAGSGCRISEALALKIEESPSSSFWDPGRALLVIRTALWRGTEQTPKTQAGVREVDLAPALNAYLALQEAPYACGTYLFTGTQHPLNLHLAYDAIRKAGIPGFHSFRRFRITHLENMGVPRGLVLFWTGHAGRDVHDRYVRLGDDVTARKYWAQKAGLGFDLPADKDVAAFELSKFYGGVS